MQGMAFFGGTDMGKVRTNNEDSFIVQHIWDDAHILAVVIDGVGGYDGGEVAAALAKKHIVEYLENYSNGERLDLLKQAVIFANNVIFSERKNLSQYSNMSCVLTAVLIEVPERRINMAHVGDTRLYQYVNNRLEKLSHDHSLVGYREEIGELTEEEAMHHPQRNIIGRDVGSTYLESSGNNYVEVATFPLLPHSILLLCSDGLCDMLASREMVKILQQPKSVEEKVETLISAANDAGGKDNVTVVLVEAGFDEDSPTDKEERSNAADSIKDNVEQVEMMTPQAIESSSNKHKYRALIWTIVVVAALFLGFWVGGLWGHKIIPQEFLETIPKDSVRNDMIYRDSIIMELQNDTVELRNLINLQEKLIIVLEDSLIEKY